MKKIKKIIWITVAILLVINIYILIAKPFIKAKDNNTPQKELYQMTILNPEIVSTEFNKTGKLTISEGRYKYTNTIQDKNWYSQRSITYEINYKYGMAIDLSKLTVDSIGDNKVSINIPVNEIYIEYLEILPNETKIDSQKSLFAKQFKPDIWKTIIQTSQKDVYNTINNDRQIHSDSLISLEENITSIVKSLGFKECYFKLQYN
jgi:hypothetical protein